MTTLGIWMPGPGELVVIGIVAIIIFGRRLPEVGRSLGQGLVEFKKGLRGVKDEVKDATADARDIADEAGRAGEESNSDAPQTG